MTRWLTLIGCCAVGCACIPQYTVVGGAPGAAVVINSCTGDLSLRSIPTVPPDSGEQARR